MVLRCSAQEELKKFMYNDGEGKWVPVQELVELRCGRPGPKRPPGGVNDIRDLESMAGNRVISGE